MKTIFKLFILVIAALIAVKAFYYLTEERQSGIMEGSDRENVHENTGHDDDSQISGVAKSAVGYSFKLPQNIQRQADIRLTRLEAIRYRSEIHATGQVVDIQPLLDLRSRYHEIQGQQRGTDATLDVRRREYERLQQLHKEAANISGRELQQARLQWESSVVESRAATVRLEDLRHEFIQSWGPELTDLFLGDSDLFRELSMRTSVLLLVTVVGDRQIPGMQTAYVSAGDHRESAEEAAYISVAPVTDIRTQGATYFFHAPVSTLRTGMNVDIWIPEADKEQQGTMVPAGAVIWYLDKPWVYVTRDKETFARVEMKKYVVTRQGWFVTEDLKAGDMVVTAGAQMLLSQEFRWSIPNEDENP